MDKLDFSREVMPNLARMLLAQEPIHTGEWQSMDVSQSKVHATYELVDMSIMMDVPGDPVVWAASLGPDLNLGWADEHFRERVGGIPLNPPPSHERWPWARHNGNHQSGQQKQFSHTYPERMWPKNAGLGNWPYSPVFTGNSHQGIRFAYGDLADVVNLLVRSPMTRQAYLPIWFPEDTGTVHGERVPCTLGYHFMIRNGAMSVTYYMRSCDLIRHLTDDLYLAGRLLQWMVDCYNSESGNFIIPGRLVTHIVSLHAFQGDRYKLEEIVKRERKPVDATGTTNT